jgi:hypothetical protein
MKIFYIIIIVNSFLTLAIGQTEKPNQLSIGQKFGGGIIFSIDPTGQHGLIAAPFDQSNNACWGSEGWTNAIYIDDGALNTEKIVTFMKGKHWSDSKTPAACQCDSLTLGGFSDWYLPSISELKEMYENRRAIGRIVSGFYCSSNESNKSNCWSIDFEPKIQRLRESSKISKGYSIRCIRKF